MTTIITRAGKGSPLTNNEVDANFTNLNTAKIEVTGTPLTGQVVSWSGTAWVPADAVISPVDSIQFDTTAGITVGAAQLAWNAADGTLDLGMGYDGVTQQIGLEQYFRIKASSAITNGQCVMFSGAVGASGVLTGAPATGVTDGRYIMGVATMDIALNGFGYITSFGLVHGLNTTGSAVGETWADGDILYYNPSVTGGLTKNPPAAPLPKVTVAAVANAGSGESGSLFIRVQAEPDLHGLSDVYAPSAITDGQILIGDTAQARWEAATITQGTGITVTNGAGAITITNSGVTAYPSAGVAVSTGSAWGTPLTAPSGSLVGTSDTQTLTNKRVTARINSQTTTTSPWAWNSDSYDEQTFTALANALTINADAGTPTDGQRTILRFKDNGTAQTLTWTTGSAKSFRAIGVTLPTTTVANKSVYVGCIYNAADSRWDAVAVAQEA